MDTYARELVFHHLYFSDYPQGFEFTDRQRWVLLELFLDAFAFDYVDVEGCVLVYRICGRLESVSSSSSGTQLCVNVSFCAL